MPPSGFNSQQASSIESFLESISELLIQEAQAKGIGPVEALFSECANIAAILNSDHAPYQSNVLSLTREFYGALVACAPASFDDFRRVRNSELRTARRAVLDVHVPETNNAEQGGPANRLPAPSRK